MSRSRYRSRSTFKITMKSDKCPTAGEICPRSYTQMLQAVIKEIHLPQGGGGLFGDIFGILRRACFAPCGRVHASIQNAVEKINGIPADEFDEMVVTRLKYVGTLGGMGMFIYGSGETAIAQYVLSILKSLADSISFQNILENTVSSMYWTGKASGYTAKIIVGIAVAKLAVDICLKVKKELFGNQMNMATTINHVISTEEGRNKILRVIAECIPKISVAEIKEILNKKPQSIKNTTRRSHRELLNILPEPSKRSSTRRSRSRR